METLTDRMSALLLSTFGYSSFREGQREIIQTVLDNRDVIGILPTGSGKSLCFQMCSLLMEGVVLVVSPLIALMEDQCHHLKKLGIPAACLHSQLTDHEFSDIVRRITTLKLLYVSPERLQTTIFLEHILTRVSFSLFVIDEAHCISHWGHDFRKEYAMLNVLRETNPHVRIMALTASATPRVLQDIVRHLRFRKDQYSCLMYGFYRPNLFYRVIHVSSKDEKFGVLQHLVQTHTLGRIIIYCGTRQLCLDVASFLETVTTGVGYYHAGMDNDERRRVKELYDHGHIRILAATNAFGMGIDHPDVRLVVHFRMPSDLDHLYQEMGRAGRDGNPAECVLLYSHKDRSLQHYFIQQSDHHDKGVLYFRLRKLIEYAENTRGCRHKNILDYFYQNDRLSQQHIPSGRCGHCDVCSPPPPIIIQPQKPKKTRLPVSSDRDKMAMGRGDIVQHLREWRKQQAESEGVPLYCILSNQTIDDIARLRPTDRQQLSMVKGIGPKKLDKYETPLLSIVSTSGGTQDEKEHHPSP